MMHNILEFSIFAVNPHLDIIKKFSRQIELDPTTVFNQWAKDHHYPSGLVSEC